MASDEFEHYMSGETVSTSTWESALEICEVNTSITVTASFIVIIKFD